MWSAHPAKINYTEMETHPIKSLNYQAYKETRAAQQVCCGASRLKGTMWSVLLFLLVQPLLTDSMVCPSSCMCNLHGAVKCVGNIRDVPKGMPTNMYLLQLNGTNMKVLNEQSLAMLPLMLRLGISHSPLDTIHPEAFHVAPQLLSIKLSSNALSSLPSRVFSPLVSLEQLHLDDNRLESIAPVLFEGLANLNELDVSNNAIARLAPNVFHGLSSLRYLNLGRNSLQQLPPTLFHSLTRLQFLMLYNNKLERLEVGAFDELANLLELKLHNNQIAHIPPEVFWALGNLMILTMSSNQLQGVPNESFYHLPKLTKLTIYKNPLLSLPDKLMGQMPGMKEFYLYTTNLSTVPWSLFANMSGMERLSLHLNNKLRELPPDLFCCLPNLQKLSLKSNDIQDLHPDIFSNLANMNTLLLNDNKLRSLSEDIFKGNPSLASIELKNNQLRTLPGEVFSTAGGLRVVTLSGNPWDCRCGIRDIASWIKLNEGMVSDRTDVICRNPYPLLLRPLGSLLDEEFKCDVTTRSSSSTTRSSSSTTRSSIELIHAVSTTALEEQEFTPTTTAPEAPSTQQTENPTESVRFTTPGSRRTTAATPTTDVGDILDDDYIFKPMGTESLPVHVLSPPFHDRLVFENGLEFVHNIRLKGWVYLWTLPPNGAYVGFLMALHILLVATGVALILAAMYGMYRLHQATEDLGAILTNRKHTIISERKQKDPDEL
ncbi:uncharacterized protein ACWYII_006706 [Salvelinus alpinus]